jgi:plasmid stabilization system protein ParE
VTYWLHPQAEAELGDAAVQYAQRASPAVAAAFLAEFERVRDLLVENQDRGPHGEFGLRLHHMDRFPYTVVYEPNQSEGPQI